MVLQGMVNNPRILFHSEKLADLGLHDRVGDEVVTTARLYLQIILPDLKSFHMLHSSFTTARYPG